MQLAANGTRVLYALGVGEELKALSCEAQGKEIRHWKSGETWKLFDLGPVSIERYGFPYFTVYRPDLLDVLAAPCGALKPDAIHLGARCPASAQDATSVTLKLESGAEVARRCADRRRRRAFAHPPGALRRRQAAIHRRHRLARHRADGAAAARTWRAWWDRTGSGPAGTSCITRCAPAG